jgi:hypothetical protein
MKGNPNPTINGQPLREYLLENNSAWIVALNDLFERLDWRSLRPPTWPVGREPLPPDIAVRLAIYGSFVQTKVSLRSLERLAQMDVGAWYICRGFKPSYNTIGEKLAACAFQLKEEFFLSVTRTLVQLMNVKPGTEALDGTVVESAASRYRLLSAGSAAQLTAQLKKRLQEEADNRQLPGQLARAEQTEQVIAEREKKPEGEWRKRCDHPRRSVRSSRGRPATQG